MASLTSAYSGGKLSFTLGWGVQMINLQRLRGAAPPFTTDIFGRRTRCSSRGPSVDAQSMPGDGRRRHPYKNFASARRRNTSGSHHDQSAHVAGRRRRRQKYLGQHPRRRRTKPRVNALGEGGDKAAAPNRRGLKPCSQDRLMSPCLRRSVTARVGTPRRLAEAGYSWIEACHHRPRCRRA